MVYGDIAGVEGLLARYLKGLGGSFSDDSTPTKTQVNEIIAEVYAEINAELAGAGVSPIPVVNSTALAALALYNNLGAAALVSRTANLGTAEFGQDLTQQYEDRLTLISQGKGVAALLLKTSAINSPISNYTEGDFEEDDEGNQKRAFTKGQVW